MQGNNDFSDLLVDSRRLARGESEGTVGGLRRGISELQEASRYLAGDERQSKALRSLDSMTGESEYQLIGYRPQQVQTTVDTDEFCQSNLEGYLMRHHEASLSKLIQEATDLADKSSQQLHQNWASKEWMSSKKKFMEGLGYRTYDWQRKETQALTTFDKSTSASRDHAATPAQPTGHISDTYLAAHAKFVRTLCEADTKRVNDIRPCAMLLESVSSFESSGADDLGYRNLLQVLSCATGETNNASSPLPAGYFAPICFKDHVPADILKDKHRALSHGTKLFLERQFEDLMRNQVQQGAALGRIAMPPSASGDSRKQLIKTYVHYLNMCSRIPEHCSGAVYDDSTLSGERLRIHLWPLVYYSLRIGAWGVAREELDYCVSAGIKGIDSALIVLISNYSKVMQQSASKGNFGSNFKEAVIECRAIYQMLKLDGTTDPFKLAVFNCISCADPGALSVPESNLEDFLWGQLLCVLTAGFIAELSLPQSKLQVSVPYGLLPGSMHSTTQFSEDELFRCILDYGGADYFDPNRGFPFKYALVLLICHRFGDSVLYLWNSNKSLPAVHLTALMLHYGLLVPHMALTQPLPSLRGSMTALSDTNPCSLMRIWVKQFLDMNVPDVSADYIATLNLSWLGHIKGSVDKNTEDALRLRCQQAFGEVIEFLLVSCTTAQLKAVVGEPCEDESRQISRSAGRLDAYMTSEDVDMLLARTAYIKLSRDADASGAVYMYTLAGRYADVIEVINSQLIFNITNETERGSSYELGKNFYTKYIQSGYGRVVNLLQRSGRLDLGRSLEFLLNVSAFSNAVKEQKYTDALGVLDGLGLLPRVEGEVVSCTQRLNTMEASLFKVLDFTILKAMQCLKLMYEHIKNVSRTQPGVLTDKGNLANDLQKRAKAIALFASLASPRLTYPDTCAQTSKYELEMRL